MILGQSWHKNYKYWRKYNAETDFYHRLVENPYYPFEDLGNGFYYLRLGSDKIHVGISLMLLSILFCVVFVTVLGPFTVPMILSALAFFTGLWSMYGHMSVRELIVSKLGGYLLRIKNNTKVLCEQEIYNIYVRLQRKTDSVQVVHYYLILGGYLLDDIRISRMSGNEGAMRLMGRRLARNLGINFFDYHDETVKHVVYHYRGRSKLRWRKVDIEELFGSEIGTVSRMTMEDLLAASEALSPSSTDPDERRRIRKKSI